MTTKVRKQAGRQMMPAKKIGFELFAHSLYG
ncbi:Uncharacterised protein [Vibrio cholerae]|nr:Uncharacterised protein [Vibrio cholerae]